MPQLTQEQLDALRARMERRREELLGEVRDVRERTEPVPFGPLADVPDWGDTAASEQRNVVDDAEIQRDMTEVRDIEAALARMEDGRYGVCCDCGQEVASERLAAYPTAKRCLACQQQYERTHRRETTPI